MKSRLRFAGWLAGIAVVCILAGLAFERQGDSDGMVPEPALSPSALPASTATTEPHTHEPAFDPVPTSAVAMASLPATDPAIRLTPPQQDVSRKQREIQLAISSDQRSMARVAADHIQACLAIEKMRDLIVNKQDGGTEDQKRNFLAAMNETLVSCQAIDATSRAQLVPLLRRSLAEGDRGAAAGLVQALGDRLKPQDEPDLVAALRRDAWACDQASLGWLMALTGQHQHLLTLNEVGMLREKEREWLVATVESMRGSTGIDPQRKALVDGLLAKAMETLKQPAGADAAEVARLSAEFKSNCPGMPPP